MSMFLSIQSVRRVYFTGLTILVSLLLILQTSESFACGRRPQLTPAQCAKAYTDLQSYIAWVNAHVKNARLAQAAIKNGNAVFKAACPNYADDSSDDSNGYTPDTIYECAVFDSTVSFAVNLGVDSSGNLVNVQNPSKVICMTENACAAIVTQKFSIFGTTQSARCGSTTDTSVIHLSDSQVQTKINALP